MANHGPLEMDETRELFHAGGANQPCYSCGQCRSYQTPNSWICYRCGRCLCTPCWRDGGHRTGLCHIPAARQEDA
jgi:hypothetical protein